MYTTFEFYTNTFCGTTLNKDNFTKFCIQACAHIDCLTYDRLTSCNIVEDNVQMAVCAVAEVMFRRSEYLSKHQTGIKSESVDGYSASFADADTLNKSFEEEKMRAASSYLPRSSPLRYSGV